MENVQYAEELVREFLVFRGFTNTLQAYEAELSTEIGRNFEVDKILDLVFSVYIPKYQLDRLLSIFSFLKQCFTSPADTVLYTALLKLEQSVLRYYVVNALKSGRQEKVIEFFSVGGSYLMQKREDWIAWFALMKISTEKNMIKCLKSDIKQLNNKLSELQALLEVKEVELSLLRSWFTDGKELGKLCSSSALSFRLLPAFQNIRNDHSINSGHKNLLKITTAGSSVGGQAFSGVYEESSTSSTTVQGVNSQTLSSAKSRAEKLCDSSRMSNAENEQILVTEEDFPEVKVDFQETFLGHNSSISSCRFSASGSNIASSSTDGTVRIWTYDSSTPSSKNATIYCGAEVSALSWECRSDRLLLIGTANGGIKAWNADAKRVVCDLSTSKDFPSVLDLKCSPVDPVFVSAAASRRICFPDSMAYENMEASAHSTPLLHIDMSAGLQITGWPAHDSPVSSVLFGPAETSIFSLGSDGKIFEWSLHNQGQIIWSRDCSRFCNPESFNKRMHEVALDSNGKRLLATSGLVRAPIYQGVNIKRKSLLLFQERKLGFLPPQVRLVFGGPRAMEARWILPRAGERA
ncbi:WD repeat-containing protein 91-like protein [Triticum urartu]|uniref:WD repeat-containing protein 91-like protein n=1 Tax=Triticum urartu TaxID=4572 RepID=M7Z9X4_TRIUA|nr:WD repeat-containing protein 91-like protein [Triticum urartu]